MCRLPLCKEWMCNVCNRFIRLRYDTHIMPKGPQCEQKAQHSAHMLWSQNAHHNPTIMLRLSIARARRSCQLRIRTGELQSTACSCGACAAAGHSAGHVMLYGD